MKKIFLSVFAGFLLFFGTSISAQTLNYTENDGSHLTPETKGEYDPSSPVQSRTAQSDFMKPVSNKAVVTCVYGNACYAGHTGIDLAYPWSTADADEKVFASAAGKVSAVINSSTGYGKHIEITHNNGYKTRYAHLRSFNVAVGDIVYTGKVIGMQGSTGNSSGPHVHFEIIKNGAFVNVNFIADRSPAKPLASDKYVSSYYSSNRKKVELEFKNGVLYKKRAYNDSASHPTKSIHTYNSTGKYWTESLYYTEGRLSKKVIQPGTAANPIISEHYYDATGKYWTTSLYYKNGILERKLVQAGTAANPILSHHYYESTGKYWTTSYYYIDGKLNRIVTQPGTSSNPIIKIDYYYDNGVINQSIGTKDYIIEYANGSPYKVKYHDIKGNYVKEEYYASQYDWVVKFKHSNGHEYYIGYKVGEGTAANANGETKMKLSSDRVFFYKYDIHTNRLEQPSGTIKKDEILKFDSWEKESSAIIPIYSASDYAYIVDFKHPSNGLKYYIGYKVGEGTAANAPGETKMKLSSNRLFFYRYDSQIKKLIQASGTINKDEIITFDSWFDDAKK